MEKEKIEDFAGKLQSFLFMVDVLISEDFDHLRDRQEHMSKLIHKQKAIWAMFDMDAPEKVRIREYEYKVFSALVDLVEARKDQIDNVPKIQEWLWAREKVAKQLWL